MGEKHTCRCGTKAVRIAVAKWAYLDPGFDFPEVKDDSGKPYVFAGGGTDAKGPNTEYLIYNPSPHSKFCIPNC
jgi:hypothetical protein